MRIAIGVVFLIAASQKLRFPLDFLESVYRYRLFGPAVSELVALWLPWTELIVGLSLVGGAFLEAAYAMDFVLGGSIVFVKAWVVRTGGEVGCGCVSIGPSTLIGVDDLALSAMFAVAIAGAWWLERRAGSACVDDQSGPDQASS
jgi:hypothetical protein